ARLLGRRRRRHHVQRLQPVHGRRHHLPDRRAGHRRARRAVQRDGRARQRSGEGQADGGRPAGRGRPHLRVASSQARTPMFKRKSKNVTRERREREEAHQLSRRALIKWSLATGAVLGLERWKVFEVLEGSSGKALAAEAACLPTNRSLHIVAGVGGFAWYQLLWPHNDVAAAGNNNFAFHAFGQTTMAEGTDRPLTLAPETPFKGLPGRRQMTAFMCGNNETHTQTPQSNTALEGSSIFAVTAALQNTNPSIIPVITIGNAPYGTAPGAPRDSR